MALTNFPAVLGPNKMELTQALKFRQGLAKGSPSKMAEYAEEKDSPFSKVILVSGVAMRSIHSDPGKGTV
jgi:hypothetical protein